MIKVTMLDKEGTRPAILNPYQIVLVTVVPTGKRFTNQPELEVYTSSSLVNNVCVRILSTMAEFEKLIENFDKEALAIK